MESLLVRLSEEFKRRHPLFSDKDEEPSCTIKLLYEDLVVEQCKIMIVKYYLQQVDHVFS